MNFRRLILAVVVLAILGGVLYWSQRHKSSDENTKTSASASPSILKLDQSAITQVTLKKKDAEPITLAKAAANKWQITEPKPLNADQDAVSGMLSSLSSLNADRVVEDKAADLNQYGFDHPAVEVDIAEKGHSPQKLLLGDDTPAGGDVYAMLAGGAKVFAIASYTKTSLDKNLNDLRDKRLLTVDPDKVSKVEVVKKGQDIEFSRIKDGWEILKPKPLRADNFAVDDLVRAVADGKMDLSQADSNDAAAKFAQATPIATAKLTGDAGIESLEIRKNKDDYYAKSSAVDEAYKVDMSLGQALDKNLDDFRNKKLFDFGFQDPNKIELQSDAKTWDFTHKGSDWWSDGKKMDASGVETLISKLRDLAANKFVDTGFTHPDVEATVTSDDGKRVEKVEISKSGSTYIARREGDASLYAIDATSVTDLTNSAASIKPAVTNK